MAQRKRVVSYSEIIAALADGATLDGAAMGPKTARLVQQFTQIEDGDFTALKELLAQVLFELNKKQQGYDFDIERNTAGQMVGIKARPVGVKTPTAH